MHIRDMQEQDLTIIDDVTRILQVKNYWKSQDKALDSNRPRSRISSDVNPFQLQTFKLPLVIKNQNPIERNKALSVHLSTLKLSNAKNRQPRQMYVDYTRIPSILVKPEHCDQLCQTVDFNDPILPSLNNTRDQNLEILESLQRHVKLFRSLSFHIKRGKQLKSINIVHADTVRQLEVKMDDNTFLTNNDILSDRNLLNDIQALKPNIGLSYRHSELRNIAMKKISRRKVKFAGIDFPYDLYIINHSRKKIIDHMMHNLSQQWGDNSKEIFEQLVKPDQEKMSNIIAKEEQEKKKNEMTSRNQLDNAYYGLKALHNKSQRTVSKIFKQLLPEDSRFYKI